MADRPQPKMDEYGVGWCSREQCECWSGDWCSIVGAHAGHNICEPWARELVQAYHMLFVGKLVVATKDGKRLRARLRAVQRAARRRITTGNGMRYNEDVCLFCYRALPDGPCRCGGEG